MQSLSVLQSDSVIKKQITGDNNAVLYLQGLFMKYIDIFAGCGGLSIGLHKAGWEGVFAIEKNKDAFHTLRHNLIEMNHYFNWPNWLEIKEYDINFVMKKYYENLRKLSGKINLVAGGPPCQGFSLAGKRNSKDQRNKMVKSYIKFISIIQPEAILFENVYGFTASFNGKQGAIKKYSNYVIEKLQHMGYKTEYSIIDASKYGIPQKRRRFILIAMKKNNPNDVFVLLEDNKERFCKQQGINVHTSVRDAISDLELCHGTRISPDSKNFSAGLYGDIQSRYQYLMRAQNKNKEKMTVDSHRFVNHSERIIQLHCELLAKAERGKKIFAKDGIFPELKRRGVTVLNPETQAPTITSIPDELVHYSEPRILTVREHARLQSFPDWYEFKGKYTSGGKRRKQEVPRYTQVGNAVPPLLAEQLGIALMEVLNNG